MIETGAVGQEHTSHVKNIRLSSYSAPQLMCVSWSESKDADASRVKGLDESHIHHGHQGSRKSSTLNRSSQRNFLFHELLQMLRNYTDLIAS